MELIPAIDLIDGKCVRLTEGDYAQQTIYHSKPVEVAKSFQDAGLRRLHLVDLDGAKAGEVKNWKVLEEIATETSLVIDFGGGVKTETDVRVVIDSGASLVTIGSVAVKQPERFASWLEKYGPSQFLLGADVRDELITVSGWLETTELSIFDFLNDYSRKGVRQFFCTDVRKDGRLEGPSIELYQRIRASFPDLHLIASGGVSSMDDLHQLASIGCSAAIVGKAIYEGKISLDALRVFL